MTGFLVSRDQHQTIDYNTAPLMLNGWSVKPEDQIMSAVRTDFTPDPSKLSRYLSKRQEGWNTIVGHDLRKELEGKPVLTAHVLDYLLANTHLIPCSWKKNMVGETLYHFFWGTIYRDKSGAPCVRYLFWGGGGWRWMWRRLDDGFDDRFPAAVLRDGGFRSWSLWRLFAS